MERLNILWQRLSVLFHRDSVIDDIDEEMRQHIEMERQHNIDLGMSEREADRAAAQAFGNLSSLKELGFEQRGGGVMDAFWRDVRFGFRMLLKSPGSSLVAALTLALGIGATAAVFSLIKGVLLTPPPYRQPEQIMLIEQLRTDNQPTDHSFGWPAAQWTQWMDQSKSFQLIAGYAWTFNFLVQPNGSESLEGMVVTKDYFDLIGVQPLIGRSFQPTDTLPNAAPVIVLGYDLWMRSFNSDQSIVGKTVEISRQKIPPTVIGVMPPGIRFLPAPSAAQEPNYNVNGKVDFWIPVILNPEKLKESSWNVVGRLNTAVSVDQAQTELGLVTTRQSQADHDFDGVTTHVESLASFSNRDGRRILLPLLGAAFLVLVIACGNVAALLLVRGLQRQREYAVRCALGAGRVTLFRQVSTESLLLAIGGGALGVGLALFVIRLFKLIGGHAIPRLDTVTTGWPVLIWGIGAAMFATILGGLYPAIRAGRLDPMPVINSAGPKSSAGRAERNLLRGVVMTQTALTLVLLVGAGLLIRTMTNLARVQTGYDTGHILTMSVTAVKADWAGFHTQALERVAHLPGVQHAAFAWGVPLTGNNWSVPTEIEGQPTAGKTLDQLEQPLRAVTEDYFNLLGLSISEGRSFRSTDTDKSSGVAIVNQAFADRYFQNAFPVGKKLWIGYKRAEELPTEIVGVVSNGRTDDLTKDAGPEIYLPLWQAHAFSKHLVIRTGSDPRTVMIAVQRELRAVDPSVAIENVKTLDDIRNESMGSRTFAAQLLVGFSVVASVLALVGIYGVLSLSVTARRREMAIRTAIGAQRRDVLKLVLGEGFRLVGVGVVAGLVVAVAFSWVLNSFLYGVKPTDPMTLIAVSVLFVAVALLACLAPARRAAKVDPIMALRCD